MLNANDSLALVMPFFGSTTMSVNPSLRACGILTLQHRDPGKLHSVTPLYQQENPSKTTYILTRPLS